jgi:4,5-DOPA dioxygenase extradiol
MDISPSAFIDRYKSLPRTPRMPVLFLGHGSPMNAIEENSFTKGFQNIAQTIPRPHAILCLSAHWLTKGTAITAMEHPQTIHDFGGFPDELYTKQYPAPGSPELAVATQELLLPHTAVLDHQWGLDHGAWSVIKHLFPDADIPVVQMSIDFTRDLAWHFELAHQLVTLRDHGVLIIGSGNIIHNLRLVDFQKLNVLDYGYDWAYEAREKFHSLLVQKNVEPLIHVEQLGTAARMAVPTTEHYIPLLYALGASGKNASLTLFNEELVGGSIGMTSVVLH